MQDAQLRDGIQANRLSADEIERNFGDVKAPLNAHEALVAADRCYFCHDAPCVTACPTSIDIPMFIRQIATGNPLGAARTIFDQNVLGGMCARDCPTEVLCEQACVREHAEGKPVQIGLLQRRATDEAMGRNVQFYERAAATGRKVAVIGAGPAGLACAHRLARHGHDVVVFEAREKPGGLNEYGVAAYKTVDGFAQREVDYVRAIGGIEFHYGETLGGTLSLDALRVDHDAVFLGVGLTGVNDAPVAHDGVAGLENAVDFIDRLRQAEDKGELEIGRRVVVIGGGMTAIDAAVQSKLLGAEEVSICYRRGPGNMSASKHEQELATSKGVAIRHWLKPQALHTADGQVSGVEFEYTQMANGALGGTGKTTTLDADQVFFAIGQALAEDGLKSSDAVLELTGRRIRTDAEGRTSLDGVWAGGDCTDTGDDLTVTAVAQGRDAAESIHKSLNG